MNVKLDAFDMALAEKIAARRASEGRRRGRQHRHGLKADGDYYELDYIGAAGELAVARALGVDHSPGDETDEDGDVEGWHVRATKRSNGSLILHHTDPDDGRFVLVTGVPPNMTVRGWCYGHEGKREVYWRRDVRSPAFFVPQPVLRRELNDASRAAGIREYPDCAYGAHRKSDWRLRENHAGWTCGVCHPPPFPAEMIDRRHP